MKRIHGRRNLSIQLDERIVERLRRVKCGRPMACFIRRAILRWILELEACGPKGPVDWLSYCKGDDLERAFFRHPPSA
jgi:hypothetical protein